MFDRSLFDTEGVWLHSRLFVGQAAQLIISVFLIGFFFAVSLLSFVYLLILRHWHLSFDLGSFLCSTLFSTTSGHAHFGGKKSKSSRRTHCRIWKWRLATMDIQYYSNRRAGSLCIVSSVERSDACSTSADASLHSIDSFYHTEIALRKDSFSTRRFIRQVQNCIWYYLPQCREHDLCSCWWVHSFLSFDCRVYFSMHLADHATFYATTSRLVVGFSNYYPPQDH